jgi:hypothetical protein
LTEKTWPPIASSTALVTVRRPARQLTDADAMPTVSGCEKRAVAA